MFRQCVRDEDGFSLLELVWSAAILLVVAMGVFGVLNFAATSTRASAARVTALNLATQQLEKARSIPYDSVGVVYPDGSVGSPAGTLPATMTVGTDYNVATTVSWARDPITNRALYKIIRVDVSWTAQSVGAISVATNIFGKSDLVNTGDMSVIVKDAVTNAPLPNAAITITPTTGTARAVSTDATGEAFFGYIPSGTYAVGAALSGYIVDVSALSAVNVIPDTLAAVTAFAQRPSSITVTVTNSDGVTPMSGVYVTAQKSGSTTLVSATTGADGIAKFDNLFVGTYTINATKSGTSPASVDVSVPAAGTDYPVTMSMSARTGLTIRVIDGSGAVVSGATAYVLGPYPSMSNVSGSPANTPTSGELSFNGLSDGTYTLAAAKSGFTTAWGSVAYNGANGVVVLQLTVPTVTTGDVEFTTYVRKKSNNPYKLTDCEMRVTGPNGYSINIISDSSGSYTLSNLLAGSYSVVPQNNFSGSSVSFTIGAGQTSQVTVYATGSN